MTTRRSNGERGNGASLFLGGQPTAAAIEAVVATYRFHLPAVQDPIAEDTAFPDMAGLFTDRTYHAGGFPPSQQTFVNEFAARYANTHPYLFDLFRWPGTQARLERAQPSLLRELHLALLLNELDLICLRDTRADQQHGLDLIIIYGRLAVGLATYIGTERSRAYRLQKLRRRPAPVLMLDVPLVQTTAMRCGSYLLYTRAHAEAVADEVARLAGESPVPRPTSTTSVAIDFAPPRDVAWWMRD